MTRSPSVRGGRWAVTAVLTGAVALIPCVFSTRTDDVFYLPKLVALWVVLVAMVWLLALFGGDGGPGLAPVKGVDLPLAAFALWTLLSWLVSTDRHQSLFGERLQHQGVLTVGLCLAFFFVARACVRVPGVLLRLLQALVAGGAVVALYAGAQRVGLDPIWHGWLPAGRVFSTIGQPNALAAYLVLVLPAAVAVRACGTGWVRHAALLSGAMAVVALAFTLSRAGYVAAGVAALVVASLWRRESRRPATRAQRVAIVLTGLLCVVPLVPAAATTVHRAVTLSEGRGDLSIRNHFDQWRVAVRIIEDHPVTGTGPETFPDQFPRYSRLVLSPARVAWFDQFRVESPHDVYLAVAAGSGIPAAIFYVWLLASLFLAVWRCARKTRDRATRIMMVCVLAAMAGHVVSDAFMSAEVTTTWLFWVVAGAAVGVASAATSGSTDPDPLVATLVTAAS